MPLFFAKGTNCASGILLHYDSIFFPRLKRGKSPLLPTTWNKLKEIPFYLRSKSPATLSRKLQACFISPVRPLTGSLKNGISTSGNHLNSFLTRNKSKLSLAREFSRASSHWRANFRVPQLPKKNPNVESTPKSPTLATIPIAIGTKAQRHTKVKLFVCFAL